MNTRARFLAAAALLTGLTFTAGPAWAQSAPKVVKKVPMEFPERAVRMGVDRGVLKTRVTIDGGGAVTGVDVVETQPAKAKVLNESVVETLRAWKFESNGKGQTFDLQVVLTAD